MTPGIFVALSIAAAVTLSVVALMGTRYGIRNLLNISEWILNLGW